VPHQARDEERWRLVARANLDPELARKHEIHRDRPTPHDMENTKLRRKEHLE
jgi:hypothetical protein